MSTFSWQFIHKLSISSTTLGSFSSGLSVDSAPLEAGSFVPFWSLIVRFSALLPIESKKVSKAAPSGFGSSVACEAIFLVLVLNIEVARWDVSKTAGSCMLGP